jgi:osmotically-inducible protein OsmY
MGQHKDKEPTSTEVLEGAQMHPQHESWIAITTNGTLIGAAILVGLIILLVVVIDLHFNAASLAVLAALIALTGYMFVWKSTPMRRRGVLGNAGLTMRIKSDLINELDGTEINVDSVNGVVTLRGNVPYPNFRGQAEQVARRGGAHRVINELEVIPIPGSPAPDQYFTGMPAVTTPEGAPEVAPHEPLEELVREAMEDDKRVNAYLLRIRVVDGVAILTGRQDTVQAGEAATEVALRVPGILGVNNDIEIESSV